jgi:XTP/dITP diphosphohydrolase
VPEPKRTARFRCVVALTPILPALRENSSPVCEANPFETQTTVLDGTCEGRIISAPRGGGGFGYDPLFVPNGYELTFAELGETVKNTLSHRAKALTQLKRHLGLA